MELRQLITFITIAELQSFTQAAETLGYAQSTITTQIQLLEKDFETKLFERLGRHIGLTSEGQRLLPYAKQMVKLADDARNAVAHPELPKGTLTIGAVESLCITRLPKLLNAYRQLYPEVELSLKFGGTSDFCRMLRDNTIDIAFFLDRELKFTDLVTVMKIPEPMEILSLPEHPLVAKEQVLPEDLAEEQLVLTETGCQYRAVFENILNSYGIKPHCVVETGSIQAIKQLTLSGLGITLLPRVAVEEEVQQKRLSVLRWAGPDMGMLTQVMMHKDKWVSAALNAWIQLIIEHLKPQPEI